MVPLVKICGLSTAESLAAALVVGVDRVGFVFYPKSPRHVSLDRAKALAAMARGRAAIVALTVDAEDETLDAIVAAIDPDMLQLHGRESPDRVAAIRARFGRPVVKALGISTARDLAAASDYAAVADELLFDAKPPAGAKLPGGNGVAFDWRILAALDLDIPFMLSGGLHPTPWARPSASRGRRLSMCRRASKARRVSSNRNSSRPLWRPPEQSASRALRPGGPTSRRNFSLEHAGQAEFLS